MTTPMSTDPHPRSEHNARAKAIRYATRPKHPPGCLCGTCECERLAYIAGWRACVRAGTGKGRGKR